MRVSVTDARAHLSDLVRRAEEGEEIILTRYGRDVVRLASIERRPSVGQRRALLEAIALSGAANATPGPSAARSQDFLYGEDGTPR